MLQTNPSTFGPCDHYQAILFQPGGIAFVLDLAMTPDGAWADQMVNVISATITTDFQVVVRLAQTAPPTTGPTVLRGSLADCSG